MKDKKSNRLSFIHKIPGLKRMDEVTIENDIRYRGPLSYRHLRILAWVLLVVSQAYTSYIQERTFAGKKINPIGISLIDNLSYLVMPLFLIAVFAIILDGRERYKEMIIMYASAALGIAILYFFVVERYAVGVFTSFTNESRATAESTIRNLITGGPEGSGHLEFNIFIDILLCVLFMFFVNHTPKKRFSGKKIIIFRLFALLPIIYEIVSNILKIGATTGAFKLPLLVFPFLTTKPPVMFLMFTVLVLIMKNREKVFIRRGKTHEDYNAFLKTNTNSFQFSLIFVVAFVVFAIIDKISFNVLNSIFTSGITKDNSLESFDQLISWAMKINQWGFGDMFTMLWLAPFMLLFSYTRKHRRVIIDIFIPIVGVASMIIVEIEYLYHIICDLASSGLPLSP